MSPSAMPATQNEGGCEQELCLPRKVPRRHGRLTATKRARASPVPQVPRLPRQTQVDVAKRHASHANGTSMSPSATLARQSAAARLPTNGDQARHQSQFSATSATPATPNTPTCRQVPRLPRKKKVDVSKCLPGRPRPLTAIKHATRPSPVP